ncbi:hypothetical protein CUC08_Gglean013407 [Alternaria sp. MG1]|nr:hypothetical protein CUC08_Gglean013407 [Alternaria sp. MG1]
MQLALLLNVLLASVVAGIPYADVFAACVQRNDCCFSTKGACQRQSSFAVERYYECGTIKLCPDFGVSLAACVNTPPCCLLLLFK